MLIFGCKARFPRSLLTFIARRATTFLRVFMHSLVEQPKVLAKEIEIDFSVKHGESTPAITDLHRSASNPYPTAQLTNPEVIRPESIEPLSGFDHAPSLSTSSTAGPSEPFLMLENTSGSLDTVSSASTHSGSVTPSGLGRSSLRHRSDLRNHRRSHTVTASSLDGYPYDAADVDGPKINLKFAPTDLNVSHDTQMTEMFGVSSASTGMKLEGEHHGRCLDHECVRNVFTDVDGRRHQPSDGRRRRQHGRRRRLRSISYDGRRS